jgi:PASTA domain
VDAFDPRDAPVVGAVRVPRPAGDDVDLFNTILLAAYEKACSNVLKVEAQMRETAEGTVVVVRCDDGPTRAVRVIYTGVTVPDLVGSNPHGVEALTAMLGLRLTETDRAARPGESLGTVVGQDPPTGVVVPAGTDITVTFAS